MMDWGGGWGMFGGLTMLLWWGLLLVGIVALVRWLSAGRAADGPQASRDAEDSALRILRERYARGEIGKEEFEARRRDLV